MLTLLSPHSDLAQMLVQAILRAVRLWLDMDLMMIIFLHFKKMHEPRLGKQSSLSEGHSDDQWWIWDHSTMFLIQVSPIFHKPSLLSCPTPWQNTKWSPYVFFRLGYGSLKVLISFLDSYYWLKSSISSICLSFLRYCYINWHKSTYPPPIFLLELLYKASCSLALYMGGDSQPCSLTSRVTNVCYIVLV